MREIETTRDGDGDDDDDDDDDEGKCHPGVIRKKCHCRIDCTRVVRKLSSELDLE